MNPTAVEAANKFSPTTPGPSSKCSKYSAETGRHTGSRQTWQRPAETSQGEMDQGVVKAT